MAVTSIVVVILIAILGFKEMRITQRSAQAFSRMQHELEELITIAAERFERKKHHSENGIPKKMSFEVPDHSG